MKKRMIFILIFIALVFSVQLFGGQKARLLRFPDIHENQVVFVYAGNLWTVPVDGGIARKLTSFEGYELFPRFSPDGKWIAFSGEYDVKWPSLGKDSIVYENGGFIYRLDLAAEKYSKVAIQLYDDKPLVRPAYKKVGSNISWYEVSPDGKRALFGARGDIFTVPAKKGETRNITQSPGAHERFSLWSPDGKWILYLSDKTGEYEFYLAPHDGKGSVQQLTKNGATYRYAPIWSPDSKKFVFSDLKQKLYYFDMGTNF